MNRAHCDNCDKPDTNEMSWIKLTEIIFPRIFRPDGVVKDTVKDESWDNFDGKSIEQDFCSFKCLKEFVSKLPDNREGFTLSELLLGLGSEKEQ